MGKEHLESLAMKRRETKLEVTVGGRGLFNFVQDFIYLFISRERRREGEREAEKH